MAVAAAEAAAVAAAAAATAAASSFKAAILAFLIDWQLQSGVSSRQQ